MLLNLYDHSHTLIESLTFASRRAKRA